MYVLFMCCMSVFFFLVCTHAQWVSIWMIWIWWTGVRWLHFVWCYNSSQFVYTSILSPITESWYCENGHVLGKLTVYNSWRKPTTDFNRSLRLAPQCVAFSSSDLADSAIVCFLPPPSPIANVYKTTFGATRVPHLVLCDNAAPQLVMASEKLCRTNPILVHHNPAWWQIQRMNTHITSFCIKYCKIVYGCARSKSRR